MLLRRSITLGLAASGLHLGQVTATAAGSKSPRDATPKYPYDASTAKGCEWWYDSDGALSCDLVALGAGIQLSQLIAWNPSLSTTCSSLPSGRSFCVDVKAGSTTSSAPLPTTKLAVTSTATSPTTTTKPANGVTTPQPTQKEMVPNCGQFYFVQANDRCDSIAAKYGLTMAQILAMNPSVGATCATLWANAYMCIGLIGDPTRTVSSVQTPQPIQPGMVSNCKKFAFVSAGDTCDGIAKANGVSVVQLVAWNTGVGSDCRSMWAQSYVCVGL